MSYGMLHHSNPFMDETADEPDMLWPVCPECGGSGYIDLGLDEIICPKCQETRKRNESLS